MALLTTLRSPTLSTLSMPSRAIITMELSPSRSDNICTQPCDTRYSICQDRRTRKQQAPPDERGGQFARKPSISTLLVYGGQFTTFSTKSIAVCADQLNFPKRYKGMAKLRSGAEGAPFSSAAQGHSADWLYIIYQVHVYPIAL